MFIESTVMTRILTVLLVCGIGLYLDSVESQPLSIAYSGRATSEDAVFVFVSIELDRKYKHLASFYSMDLESAPAVVEGVKKGSFGLISVNRQGECKTTHPCFFVEHISMRHDGKMMEIIDLKQRSVCIRACEYVYVYGCMGVWVNVYGSKIENDERREY